MNGHVRTLSKTITNSVQASAHKISEAGQEAITKSTKAVQHILHYDQLPEWRKVDSYIRYGYRREFNSFTDCFWSLFYKHNELVNTWSHLLPALGYLVLLLGLDFWSLHSDIKVSCTDNAFFQFYIAATASCLSLSAVYHGTNTHSEIISRNFLKLDYLGIVFGIVGTNVSSTYFGLYGNLSLQRLYFVLIVVCSVFATRNLLRDDIDGPGAAPRRVMMFIALASSGVLPFLHVAFTQRGQALEGFALPHIAVAILLYLLALLFYLTHIPEKWWPGSFDIWGSSHQIFHILISVGQVVFLLGLRKVMLRRYLPLQELDTLQISNDTSLSLWMEPCTALWGGLQLSNETSLSLWIEPGVAM